jgi:hypothetical protein
MSNNYIHFFDLALSVFEKTSEVGPEEKTEEIDWKDRAGKNWYY